MSIRLIGYESDPIPRLHIEMTGDDIDVLEWLKGRTYTLAYMREHPDALDMALGERPRSRAGVAVLGFLGRLHEAIGHIRCCVDQTHHP